MTTFIQYATTTCSNSVPVESNKPLFGTTSLIPVSGSNQNFQFASSSCVTVQSFTFPDTATSTTASSTAATSTVVYAYQGMTYGDIIISFLLLVLVAGQFFGGILNRLIGVKGKLKQHQKYDY